MPFAIGLAWGDPWGAVFVAGFTRLGIQWHCTFMVNSSAHMFGVKSHCDKSSARDSFIVALFTWGEGYHSYHHRFPGDYRCGVKWHHADPTKWFLWTLDKVGLASQLHRTPAAIIERSRQSLLAKRQAA